MCLYLGENAVAVNWTHKDSLQGYIKASLQSSIHLSHQSKVVYKPLSQSTAALLSLLPALSLCTADAAGVALFSLFT